jgi:hypothetical protein
MPAPSTQFVRIAIDTALTAVNTRAKRTASIAGQSVISTGSGNEADLGTVDISSGTASSTISTMLWRVTNAQGNTAVSTFKIWMSTNSFAQAGTLMKIQPLRGNDEGTTASTETYIANATIGSYTFATKVETEPGAQNIYPSSESASMTPVADAVMWAEYLRVANGETTGTYAGTTSTKLFQQSFKYSYS